MAKITVTVCDVCDQQPTAPYRVTHEGTTYDLDLCDRHSRPLRDLIAKASPVPSRRRFKSTVATLEEIEARKTATQA